MLIISIEGFKETTKRLHLDYENAEKYVLTFWFVDETLTIFLINRSIMPIQCTVLSNGRIFSGNLWKIILVLSIS